MTVRVEVVTPCTHCEGLGTHHVPFPVECSFCNGSGDEDRRTFTEWPPEVIVEMARYDFEGEGDVVSWDRLSPRGREIRVERMALVAGILWDRITS